MSRPASICMVVEAGARFAVGNRPVDRGGAAIFREQGAVQVDPSEARDGDEARRNNLAVGDDDDDVGRGAAEIFVATSSVRIFCG